MALSVCVLVPVPVRVPSRIRLNTTVTEKVCRIITILTNEYACILNIIYLIFSKQIIANMGTGII